MNRSFTMTRGGAVKGIWPILLVLLSLLTFLLLHDHLRHSATLHFGREAGGMNFSYEVITSDMAVDWPGGGDFDPRDRCPQDFFANGFQLICKKLKNGEYTHFLFHKGKQLLYRIDKDIIRDKAKIGLHWVESTRYSARYRIADQSFKGGKTITVPNGKGGMDTKTFQYGEAVSKKRIPRRRELFDQTHITPKQCAEWWDIFNFIP